jgi:hypothetical protein
MNIDTNELCPLLEAKWSHFLHNGHISNILVQQGVVLSSHVSASKPLTGFLLNLLWMHIHKSCRGSSIPVSERPHGQIEIVNNCIESIMKATERTNRMVITSGITSKITVPRRDLSILHWPIRGIRGNTEDRRVYFHKTQISRVISSTNNWNATLVTGTLHGMSHSITFTNTFHRVSFSG